MNRITRRTTTLLAGAFALATGALSAQSPAAAPELSDAEIAHVAVTANAIDVELARRAAPARAGAEVRSFAERMIADHTAVNAQAAELAARLGVTPVDNAVSRSLRAGAESAAASLAALTGSAFDRAYLEREVGYHQAVLEALDGLLIPSTENAELRSLLVAVRPAIEAHLEHAKSLRATLAAAR